MPGIIIMETNMNHLIREKVERTNYHLTKTKNDRPMWWTDFLLPDLLSTSLDVSKKKYNPLWNPLTIMAKTSYWVDAKFVTVFIK